jgi:hypothetical protein
MKNNYNYYDLGVSDVGVYKNKFLQLVREKMSELFRRWGKVGALYNEEKRYANKETIMGVK